MRRKDSRLPRFLAHVAAVAALAAIGWLDYATGRRLTPSLFYGLVVVWMGWMDGVAGVLVTSALAVVVDVTTDFYLAPGPPLDPIDGLNEVLRTTMWVFMGMGAAAMRKRLQEIDLQRRRLDEAYQMIQEDVAAAERVQRAFLQEATPSDPRCEMAVRYLPARGLSGDFYSIKQQGDRLFLCVADVSGKGPPAALVTALLRGALDEARRDHDRPAEVLSAIHQRILPYLPDAMFVTCFFATLDLQDGAFSYASAGHDPAYLRRASGGLEDMVGTGLPLGIQEEQAYAERNLCMGPGDCLLVYTDGLVNGRTPGGGRLGEGPVREALAAGLEPEGLVVRLQETILQPPEDDVVLLALTSRPGRRITESKE